MKFKRELLRRRAPDFLIGDPALPYMRRWWLTERIEQESKIYLHNIQRDDDDRALHDHPSNSISIILRGGYIEHLFAWPPVDGEPLPPVIQKRRRVGMVIFRDAATAHRLELRKDRHGKTIEAWTLFVFRKNTRQWGFWCTRSTPAGEVGRWKHWTKFVAVGSPGEVGPGCGD